MTNKLEKLKCESLHEIDKDKSIAEQLRHDYEVESTNYVLEGVKQEAKVEKYGDPQEIDLLTPLTALTISFDDEKRPPLLVEKCFLMSFNSRKGIYNL